MIGLVSPGGVVTDAQVQTGFTNLEALGFKVKEGRNLRAAHGGYAGTVAERLADLHAMFEDRAVRGLWCARGGSGCSALLPAIDYALVRRQPKAVVGYSDITALHLALYRRAGVVSFHGPVSSSTFSEYSVARLRETLMEPRPTITFSLAEDLVARGAAEPQFVPRTLRAGRAEGRLAGGNLSTLCALVGTPYGLAARGALLFLEDVGEAPYRVDRMLTQLRQAGVLGSAAGLMLGVFQKSGPPDEEPSLSLGQVLDEQLQGLKVPVSYGHSFGHVPQQYTLPMGIRARLDTEARTLTLLEAAVT